MSEVSDFLNALFASTDADISFDLNGQTVTGGDKEFLDQNIGNLRVSPLTAQGSCFVFGVQDESYIDDFQLCQVQPSAVLFKDDGTERGHGTSIFIWCFDQPVDDIGLSILTDALGMADPGEFIPLPKTDGWELSHLNADNVYTLDDLCAAYVLPEIDDAARQGVVETFGTYGDATIRAPYSETDYSQEITVTLGAKTDSKQWKPMQLPLGAFIAKLCRHVEGTKDGPAFVLADMVPGQRLKNSVKTLFAIGLDVDTGTPSDVVDAALTKLGCLAVRYTTHSHGKTKTEFKKDKVVKFSKDRPLDDDVIRDFLREVEHWDESIIETASYAGVDHNERGIVVQVSHIPMPKHRIVVPLAAPFEIANEGPTQAKAMEKWAKVPKALAKLLGVPFDTSCTDPSRLFYFPRHAKGRPFEISVWGGPLFDGKTLQLENTLDKLAAEVGKGSGKSSTPEGKDLGRWSLKKGHGFQIADVIEEHCPDRIRGNATRGFDIECPFDEDHSNAGDTNDKACFAVNAGDGQSEFFTISCRHETCRDKTMLDHLGKMLKDGWFDKDVLDDERYNAAVAEDAPQPKVAEKLEKEDDARAAYLIAIDRLTPDSKDPELEEVINIVLDAALGSLEEGRAEERMKERLDTTMAKIRQAMKRVRGKRNADAQQQGKVRDKNGKLIFGFNGDYNFDEASDMCFRALKDENTKATKPLFSCIDDQPVRMMTKSDEGKTSIRFDPINANTLWSELCTMVTFVRRTEQGDGARQQVPKEVSSHVYEQAYRRLPQAPEVIYTPLFLSDGKLVITPKYHYDASDPDYLNILLVDNGLNLPEVPSEPDANDVEESVNWIRTELLSDFPFLDYDSEGNERREVSEANAIAMLLTPFMRRMINGRTPVFFVYKPQPGTGGTLLGQMPMWLFDGSPGSATRYSQNEEEMQKGLIAAVQERKSHLFFDDVKDFNNRELLRAITQANISGRLLGSSKNISVPNRFNWVGTGNNTVILDEMRRRTVMIRLNAKMPDVGKRKFRHPDISGLGYEQFLQQNRGIAVKHVLTLIQYWINTGMVPFTLRRRASFEDWSAKVGGVLQACGIEGFLDNFNVAATDLDEAANKQFIRDFFQKHGTNNVQKPNQLFEWALENMMDILNGNTEEQKRTRFIKKDLIALDGRTYAVGEHNYMFQQTMDDDQNIGFQLVKVADTMEDEPAAAA